MSQFQRNLQNAPAMNELEMTETATTNHVSTNGHPPYENRQSEFSTPYQLWTYKHIVATCIASFGMISIGAGTQGYVTTAVPNINSHRNPFHMSTTDTLIFVTMNNVAALISSLAVGWLIDRYGRKLNMIIGCVLITIGLAFISAATRVEMMHIGQFIGGLGAGVSQPTIAVYIAEISPVSIRGSLMTCYEISYNFGLLLAFTIGSFVNWRWQAIACALVSAINTCILIIIPDSPRWLLMVGQKERCMESIQWFYKDDSDVLPIVAEIDEALTETKTATPWKSFLKLHLLKLVIMSQMLFILREFIGMSTLRRFIVEIFDEAATSINPNLETILFGVATVIGSVLCVFIVDRCNRRLLITLSFGILTSCMIGIAAYFQLKYLEFAYITEIIRWIPLLSMIVSAIVFSIGIGPLAYTVSTELFPTPSRGRANALAIVGLNVWMLIANWLFGNLLTNGNRSISFWTFSAVGIIGMIFSHFFLPETRTKLLY